MLKPTMIARIIAVVPTETWIWKFGSFLIAVLKPVMAYLKLRWSVLDLLI